MAIKNNKNSSQEVITVSTDQSVQPKKIPFAVSEAYKSIRTNLISIMEKTGKKVLAISSPNAAEGKSTTSINIAISFSQLNKKVLLVDADAHHPSIHNKLKLQNLQGFLTVMTGESTIKEVSHHYNDTLDILTSGPLVSNPTELLSSDAFTAFLDTAKQQYDVIIFDVPPVNILSDAQIVAQKCDGMILIVRAGVTTHDALARSLSIAKSLSIDITGLVLNGSDFGTKRYYSRYYNKYYGHYGRSGRYDTPNDRYYRS